MKYHSVILLCLLGLGLFLTITVHFRLWQTVDLETILALQAILPRSLEAPFSLLNILGSAEITTAILLAIVFLRPHPARYLPFLFSFGLMTLLELIGKTVINQPFTPSELRRTVFFFEIPFSYISTKFSFPSGHVARTTFLVFVVATLIEASRLRLRGKILLDALLICIVGCMIVSRIYLAEHWMTDVIGGVIFGMVFALFTRHLNVWTLNASQEIKPR